MTLCGRWDTRLLLTALIGLPLTFGFCWLYGDSQTPLVLLGYTLSFGLGWDVLYYRLQSRRWDRDWPPLLLVLSGLWEGIVLWQLARHGLLPDVSTALTAAQFWLHYTTVFGATFAATFALPLFSLHGRYHGGQWLDG